MPRSARRRSSPIRLLRAIWRYRRRIEGHGDRYHRELATAVRTAFDERLLGRTALGGYRVAMRALVIGALALALVALLVAALAWRLHPLAALLALVPLVGAGMLGWWRLTWGAPLDWLEEHADPQRSVTLTELPARLRALARETRDVANVPARLADELDALAAEVEQPVGAASAPSA